MNVEEKKHSAHSAQNKLMKYPLPEVTNLDEAVKYIQDMRHWSPFLWSGMFYLLQTPSGVYAYRNIYSVKNRVKLENLESYSILKLG